MPDIGLSRGRFAAIVGPSALFLILVLLLTPWVGSTDVSWQRVIDHTSPDYEIFVLLRLPRILFAALAGGSLAVAGVLFQAILRNALATPFTLGVASGSSFGAVLAIVLGLEVSVLGVPFVSVAAFLGAMLTVGLVFLIARTRRELPTFTLLLAGVTLNFVFAALILLIYYLATFTETFLMVRWMMGNINDASASYSLILKTGGPILVTLALLLWLAPQLNLLAAGEDWATTRGVNVGRLKQTAFIAASLLTGLITAVTGPIGFVGLIVPHALRMIAGADHRVLIPSAFFVGGGFLVLCDTAARTVLAPSELPVGVVTALLGGPFFILLLKRHSEDLF